MTKQCNRTAERLRRDMFPSAAEEVAVVETPSLQWFQRIRGMEMRPSLRLTIC
jgi:hypothetical protein